MTMTRDCSTIRDSFSDYLDGAVSGLEMQAIAEHLGSCHVCTQEFDEWRAMQHSLAMLRPAKAPANLGLKLRLAISRENSKRTFGFVDRLKLQWENSVRPMLIQVSAGFAVAVALLAGVGFLLGTVAVPQAVLANDEPLGAMTAPHYLYSATHPLPIVTPQDTTIVVEAEVNDQGRVYDYNIVSGPQDPGVSIQVGDQLLLSVFEPARVFGAPIRGRVLLTFAGVSVRG